MLLSSIWEIGFTVLRCLREIPTKAGRCREITIIKLRDCCTLEIHLGCKHAGDRVGCVAEGYYKFRFYERNYFSKLRKQK